MHFLLVLKWHKHYMNRCKWDKKKFYKRTKKKNNQYFCICNRAIFIPVAHFDFVNVLFICRTLFHKAAAGLLPAISELFTSNKQKNIAFISRFNQLTYTSLSIHPPNRGLGSTVTQKFIRINIPKKVAESTHVFVRTKK